MHKIKTRQERKYHNYALTNQLPPLTEAVLTSRPKGSSLESSSKLLELARSIAVKKQYLYLDMHRQDDQLLKMLERQSTTSSQEEDEETEKHNNKYVHELYNLSPASRSTLKYISTARKQAAQKESLRAAIRNRVNEIVNPEHEQSASYSPNLNGKHPRFMLLLEPKNSKLDQSLRPNQRQLVRKFGIVSNYCFEEKSLENLEPIRKIQKPAKHLSTISTQRVTSELSTISPISPKASTKLPLVRRAQTLEPISKSSLN